MDEKNRQREGRHSNEGKTHPLEQRSRDDKYYKLHVGELAGFPRASQPGPT